jgi:hypothetical protein
MNASPPQCVARSTIGRFASVSVIIAILSEFLCAGCRSDPLWTDGSTANGPSPELLIDRLQFAGNSLRKLDVLDMEGTSGLRSGQRADYHDKMRAIADGYSHKYGNDLQDLSDCPRRAVDYVLARKRKEAAGNAIATEILDTIGLHLRLARAKVPPTTADIIRDYRNLRYINPHKKQQIKGR